MTDILFFLMTQLTFASFSLLAYAKDTFPPEFQYCIPINKTRSGMQVRSTKWGFSGLIFVCQFCEKKNNVEATGNFIQRRKQVIS